MHFTTIFLVGAATLAAAQTSTTLPTATVSAASGSSSCQAQQILDTCVSQRTPQISACAGNDWACLCQQYGALLTCYDNCPGDPARFGATQQQSQNCAAASAYGTTTLMVASSTSSPASTSTKASTSTSGSSGSGTASGSAASATKSGAAITLNVELTGGVLAVVAAGFGVFL